MWFEMTMCVAVAIFSPLAVTSNNNLRTLRTLQRQVCDDEELQIECWPNTVISISQADYGSPVAAGNIQCLDMKPANHKSTCVAQDVRENIQSSCKEKQKCHLRISSKLLNEDHCPGVQRYLDVSFKCRPSKFFTRVVCENEQMKLRCRKSLHLVIYSAFFGSSEGGAEECPEEGIKKYEECEAGFATETAMTMCQGRRKCTLSADSASFGLTTCSAKARMFLKVVYTCVPKDSLQDLEFEEDSDIDYPSVFKEPNASEILHNLKSADNIRVTTPTSYNKDFVDFNVITTTKKVDVQSDETSDDTTDVNCTVADDNQKVIGFLSEWIAAYKFITENKEKFILYVTLSLGCGILLFLLVLTVRLYAQQQRQLKKAKLNISEPLPLHFDEDVSDLDQYDPRHDHGVEVVRYTNTSTIRRQDSTSQPRAPLAAHSMNNYYYS